MTEGTSTNNAVTWDGPYPQFDGLDALANCSIDAVTCAMPARRRPAFDPRKPVCRCPIHGGGDQANADEEDGYCEMCRVSCPKFDAEGNQVIHITVTKAQPS